ncbi:PIN domain-like protein [Suillus subluteus]|nr:PIN domain-like protein [Suillus subluteus]
MGIPGLWENTEQLAVSELKTEEIDGERKVKLFKIGIDARSWKVARAANTVLSAGHTAQATPACGLVFDGLKRLPEKGRMVRNSPHWLTCDFQCMLELFGFKWTEAPGEAEAELAAMNAHGVIDAAMTEDSDILIFGAPCIIRRGIYH